MKRRNKRERHTRNVLNKARHYDGLVIALVSGVILYNSISSEAIGQIGRFVIADYERWPVSYISINAVFIACFFSGLYLCFSKEK